MSKREFIIVIIAGLIGIYGIVDYFVLPRLGAADKSDPVAEAKAHLDKAVQNALADLAMAQALNAVPGPKEIIIRSETPWEKDPFGTAPVPKVQTPGADADMPELLYSGFVKAGRQILAIINGMEYSVGEMVKDASLTLSRITPTQVVLLSGSQKEIILQLQEN